MRISIISILLMTTIALTACGKEEAVVQPTKPTLTNPTVTDINSNTATSKLNGDVNMGATMTLLYKKDIVSGKVKLESSFRCRADNDVTLDAPFGNLDTTCIDLIKNIEYSCPTDKEMECQTKAEVVKSPAYKSGLTRALAWRNELQTNRLPKLK